MTESIQSNKNKLHFALLLASVLCTILIVIRYAVMDVWTYRWLVIPNLLLAWIPYLLSEWIHILYDRRRRMSIWLLIVGLAWLFFYPNTSYIWTDLVHLSFFSQSKGTTILNYDLLINVLAAATGWLLGVFSLYRLHRLIYKESGAWQAHTFAMLVLLLSSIGVYLGRFLRWNTWDLLVRPFSIIGDTYYALLDKDAMIFIATFALVTASLYFIMYSWKHSTH
ncbi:MAG: uncharacterized protein K0Q81_2169 [Paenibacillus sp.]|nr:uncharacterized protein [Paenibacillus sp.]